LVFSENLQGNLEPGGLRSSVGLHQLVAGPENELKHCDGVHELDVNPAIFFTIRQAKIQNRSVRQNNCFSISPTL